jgi:hypothetical protein
MPAERLDAREFQGGNRGRLNLRRDRTGQALEHEHPLA